MFQINYDKDTLEFIGAHDTDSGMNSPAPYFEITEEEYTAAADDPDNSMTYVDLNTRKIISGIIDSRHIEMRKNNYMTNTDSLFFQYQADLAQYGELNAVDSKEAWLAARKAIKLSLPLNKDLP